MKKVFWAGATIACVALAGYWLVRHASKGSPEDFRAAKAQASGLAIRSEAVPLRDSKIDQRAVTVGQGAMALTSKKTAAQRLRNGERLAQLHAELIAGTDISASSQYQARKIVEQCLLTWRMTEATYVPVNENTRAIAIASLRKRKESCAGLDTSPLALSRMAEQKKFALAKGEPVATADETLLLAGRGFTADAFEIAKGLLMTAPENPDVWERAIGMLPALGIQIGGGDDLLRRLTPEQMGASVALAACEATSSCSYDDSLFLQNECVIAGRCSHTMLDYLREFALPPSEILDVPVATARLLDLISQRRWDLIGYASGNRPVQTKPSVLPPRPNK